MSPCTAEVLIAYLFGALSMVFFVLWYGQRSERVRDEEEDGRGDE